ncbi:MAG: NAD(P)-binding domain-containing protein [Chloroflexota bacterium]
MKIGIIGAGRIGSTSARLFVRAGHEVTLSNSRGPETLERLVQEIGQGAHARSVDDAARWADLVLLAVPFRNREALPAPETVRGKIVIDATNPYDDNFGVMDLGEQTSSEIIAQHLPGARIVKAFNTIYFEHLARQGDTTRPREQRRAIFVAGDDTEAKETVSRLIEEIGFAAIDSGNLRDGGRRQQPGSPVYNQDLTATQAHEALASLA